MAIIFVRKIRGNRRSQMQALKKRLLAFKARELKYQDPPINEFTPTELDQLVDPFVARINTALNKDRPK